MSRWNTEHVDTMTMVFLGASSFNCPIGNWKVFDYVFNRILNEYGDMARGAAACRKAAPFMGQSGALQSGLLLGQSRGERQRLGVRRREAARAVRRVANVPRDGHQIDEKQRLKGSGKLSMSMKKASALACALGLALAALLRRQIGRASCRERV